MRREFRFSGIVLTVIVLVGCSGKVSDKWSAKRQKTSPAAGIVNYQGKPVEGATVIFSPVREKEGSAASGVTDASGRFTLGTFDQGDGAVAGKYKVTVTKVDMSGQSAAPASHDAPAPKTATKHLVPEKYGKPESSALTAEVTDGGKNEYTFDLKD